MRLPALLAGAVLLSLARHRRLLEALRDHLAETEKFRGVPSRLHQDVLTGLGNR